MLNARSEQQLNARLFLINSLSCAEFLRSGSGLGGTGKRTLPKGAETAIKQIRSSLESGDGVTDSMSMSKAAFSAAAEGLSARKAEERARCGLVRALAGTKVRHLEPEKMVAAPSMRIERATTRRPNPPNTMFRVQYESGNLPIRAEHTNSGIKVGYKGKIGDMDYQFYLPVFVSGLREREEPFMSLATVGTIDLIRLGGTKVLPVVP